MQDSLAGLRAEHASLQEQLSDSAVHSNPALSKKLNRRYAELSTILDADSEATRIEQDLEAATELAAEDESFAAELPKLEEQLAAAKERLRRLLIPRDPDDGRDVILEIKAGGLTLAASVPVGLEPVAVAVRDDKEVWVVNHLSDSVSVVDVSSLHTILDTELNVIDKRKLSKNDIDLALTTNAFLLPAAAQKLKDAGLKRINISLDTLRPDVAAKIAQKDVFKTVFKGIQAADDAGLKIKINCVPIPTVVVPNPTITPLSPE